jgi:hypothetical protein
LSHLKVISFPSLFPSIYILLKTGIVVLFIFLIVLALILVDLFLKNQKVSAFIFGNLASNKTQCQLPLVQFVVYVLYVLVFIVCFSLVSRKTYRLLINYYMKRRYLKGVLSICFVAILGIFLRSIEVVSAITQWNDIGELFRLISSSDDILLSLLVVYHFVFMPIIDILRTNRFKQDAISTEDPTKADIYAVTIDDSFLDDTTSNLRTSPNHETIKILNEKAGNINLAEEA